MANARQFMAARTAAWGGKALPYDAEVEYLESDGGQVLTFPVHTTSKLTVILDISSVYFTPENPLSKSDLTFLTCGNKYAIRIWHASLYSSYGSVSYLWDKNWVNGFKRYLDGFHSIGIDHYEYNGLDRAFLSVDGNKNIMHSYPSIWDDGIQNFILKSISYQIKEVYVSNDGDVLADMFPVRFMNENGVSEGAMFDKVSGQLFRNAGTGAFIIGPDKTT